jgi:hypothetical protein
MRNEISFKLDVAMEPRTRADFTYKITPSTISITDTTLGKLSVSKDIDAVLRKIEQWHQGSIAAFKSMYRDEHGVWNGVRWNGQCASVLALCETDEKGNGKTVAPECRMRAKGASGLTHSMKEGASRSFSFIEPMKALPVDKLPEGDWLYEIKHDGYRALAFKDGKDVRLISRNNKPLNYPQVLDSLKLLAVEQAILAA